MLSILLFLSITALLYQFPATETHALDYAEAQKSVTALKQLSKFTNVANYPLVEVQAPWFPSHSIGVEQLTVDDTVVLSYTSPEKGRVILRFIQEETNDIIFSIDLRYTYDKFNEKNVVVFNSRKDGVWGREMRPRGFNFTPNVEVKVIVIRSYAAFDVFTIIEDGETLYAGSFPYRLSPDLVNLVRVEADGNNAVDNVGFGVFYNKE